MNPLNYAIHNYVNDNKPYQNNKLNYHILRIFDFNNC
jgi:hypothetical protein